MDIRVFSPCTLEEAGKVLEKPNGIVLAGGTDLIIELRKGERKPDYIVDIGAISEIKLINIEERRIRLGAAVTFADIINNEKLKMLVPSLWASAYHMGACQIQNRATIGGNICNAAPAADSTPVFLSLNAECIIFSTQGRRRISIDEFILGSKKNCLRQSEMLEAVEFDLPQNNEYMAFSKLGKRNALAISTIACAVKIKLQNNIIREASVCTGSMGSKAIREKEVQAYLINKELKNLDIEKAADILSREAEERLRGRASIGYKKVAVKGVFKEALVKCIDKAKDVKSNE